MPLGATPAARGFSQSDQLNLQRPSIPPEADQKDRFHFSRSHQYRLQRHTASRRSGL